MIHEEIDPAIAFKRRFLSRLRHLRNRLVLFVIAFLVLDGAYLYLTGQLWDWIRNLVHLLTLIALIPVAWWLSRWALERDWLRELEALIARLRSWLETLRHQDAEIRQQDYENMPPEVLLAHATEEERQNLAHILGVGSMEPQILTQSLLQCGQQLYERLMSRACDYEMVLTRLAQHLDKTGKPTSFSSYREGEARILACLLEQMPAEEYARLKEVLSAEAHRAGIPFKGELVTASTLGLANLGSFSTYVLASSALSSLAGTLGLTLPFSVYTGLSSALSVVIGPLGWGALAAWAGYKLNRIDYKRLLAAVLLIAAVRNRLIMEREQTLRETAAQIVDVERMLTAFEELCALPAREALKRLPGIDDHPALPPPMDD